MELMVLWKLLAGIAFFLWGMQLIEEALHFLSSRHFKLFLKKLSASRMLAVLGGTLASLVMQSSSLVNMIILAFVASGVIQLENSLALILGSNLGTTFNNWVILLVGFKMEVSGLSYALAGTCGFLMYLTRKGKPVYQWSQFIFGIGIILIGLNLIKTGMEQTTSAVDLAAFNKNPLIVFLLIGLGLTAVLQASSATVIIVLSALNANAITLLAGMAAVLGSEIGTTLKFLLISFKGIPDKKRVAVGNVSLNIICAALIFIFLKPIDHLIKDIIGLKDPLISVVFFQTLINVVAILLFIPLLRPISQLLNLLFRKGTTGLLHIEEVNATNTQNALEALEKDISYFFHCALTFTHYSFDLAVEKLQAKSKQLPKIFRRKNNAEQYEYLKSLHGELHQYGHRVLTGKEVTGEMESRLDQLMTVNRNIMYACKNIKDAFDDLHTLRESSNDVKFGFYTNASKQMNSFLKAIQSLLKENESKELFTEIKELYNSLPDTYNKILHQLYKDDLESRLNVTEISTLLNFNREIYTALKSYLFAIKDYLLSEKEGDYFDELPGFIR